MQQQRLNPHRRPAWHELAARFTDERECLASFLALETAEIIDGAKPANLFNLVNRPQRCGRNLYQLWRRYGEELMAESGLTALEMADRGGSLLLLVYRAEALDGLLARRDVAAVLRRSGYREPLERRPVLAELQQRIATGDGFPHEIGVFLGYPLKDVVGFLGWAPLPFACQGQWKIYGDPDRSLQLHEAFRRCRGRMARRLAAGAPAIQCLCSGRCAPANDSLFFGPKTENDNQNQTRTQRCASH